MAALPKRTSAADAAIPASGDAIYVSRPSGLRPGNRVTPLFGGGEAYPAMLKAIRDARASVNLETYILESDATGWRFAEALRERARAGVMTRLLYDAVGGMTVTAEFLAALRSDGVQVVEYHPVVPWRKRFNLSRRDHRKILVVDEVVAFTGGLNIGDDYAAVEDGGRGWYDVHCEVRGPCVQDFARMFRRVWISEGGQPFELAKQSPTEQAGEMLARVVENKKISKRWAIRRAYLHAIHHARHSICVMNAYFLPDRRIRWALHRAVRRGVRVSVIVPEDSDVSAVEYASSHMAGRLLRKGVEYFQWPETMMHAKTAVIDGIWSTIGSYNIDHRSLFYNLEVVIEVIDRRLGALLAERFQRDLAVCKPMTLEVWKRRSWWRWLGGWFFYQFRRWL